MNAQTNFYRALEDKYRGSEELIKHRLEVYLPFIKKIKKSHAKPKAIDLGCGRGEWLELLNENGCETFGVDLDEGMLKSCLQKQLNVKHQDAIEALQSFDNDSLSIVSGFHIAEHLPFEILQVLVQEALRALVPGGLLILETPNPENLRVSMENFYLDPTHIRPIPSLLLSFLSDYYGFKRTKVLRLQESHELKDTDSIALAHVINSASPDYAIIAQKNASLKVLQNFDALFTKEYGIPIDSLINKFDIRLSIIEQIANEGKTKAAIAEQRAAIAEQSANEGNIKAAIAEQRATGAEQSANEAWKNFYAIKNSTSWKLTKPLRLGGKFVRWLMHGAYHWLTFSPTSRPRRVLKKKLTDYKNYINVRPKLKSKIVSILNHFPTLRAKLKRIGQGNHEQLANLTFSHLSPEARKIYYDLKNAIEKKETSK